jgi:hypothetical protein
VIFDQYKEIIMFERITEKGSYFPHCYFNTLLFLLDANLEQKKILSDLAAKYLEQGDRGDKGVIKVNYKQMFMDMCEPVAKSYVEVPVINSLSSSSTLTPLFSSSSQLFAAQTKMRRSTVLRPAVAMLRASRAWKCL